MHPDWYAENLEDDGQPDTPRLPFDVVRTEHNTLVGTNAPLAVVIRNTETGEMRRYVIDFNWKE